MTSFVTGIQLTIASVPLHRKYPINFFHSISIVNLLFSLNTFVSVLLMTILGGGRLGRKDDQNNWEACIFAEIKPGTSKHQGCMVIVVFNPAQKLRFLSRFTKQIKLLSVPWCSCEAELVEMIISLRLSLFFCFKAVTYQFLRLYPSGP